MAKSLPVPEKVFRYIPESALALRRPVRCYTVKHDIVQADFDHENDHWKIIVGKDAYRNPESAIIGWSFALFRFAVAENHGPAFADGAPQDICENAGYCIDWVCDVFTADLMARRMPNIAPYQFCRSAESMLEICRQTIDRLPQGSWWGLAIDFVAYAVFADRLAGTEYLAQMFCQLEQCQLLKSYQLQLRNAGYYLRTLPGLSAPGHVISYWEFEVAVKKLLRLIKSSHSLELAFGTDPYRYQWYENSASR